MITEGKIWGVTSEVYRDDTVSVNYLEIKAHGFCSEHCHARKTNIFIVLEGELAVRVWRDRALIDFTVLKPGMSLHVLPGQWHQFEAKTVVRALEIYRVRLEDPDIDRRTQGGKRAK